MLKRQMRKSAARKPLADISNGGKSLKSRKKKIAEESDGGALDRLLLVRSDLANLVSKVRRKETLDRGSSDLNRRRSG